MNKVWRDLVLSQHAGYYNVFNYPPTIPQKGANPKYRMIVAVPGVNPEPTFFSQINRGKVGE